jgi:hypothetical protein
MPGSWENTGTNGLAERLRRSTVTFVVRRNMTIYWEGNSYLETYLFPGARSDLNEARLVLGFVI